MCKSSLEIFPAKPGNRTASPKLSLHNQIACFEVLLHVPSKVFCRPRGNEGLALVLGDLFELLAQSTLQELLGRLESLEIRLRGQRLQPRDDVLQESVGPDDVRDEAFLLGLGGRHAPAEEDDLEEWEKKSVKDSC